MIASLLRLPQRLTLLQLLSCYQPMAKQTSRLLKLPAELRNQIYDGIFADRRAALLTAFEIRHPLLRTCCLLRREALPMWWDIMMSPAILDVVVDNFEFAHLLLFLRRCSKRDKPLEMYVKIRVRGGHSTLLGGPQHSDRLVKGLSDWLRRTRLPTAANVALGWVVVKSMSVVVDWSTYDRRYMDILQELLRERYGRDPAVTQIRQAIWQAIIEHDRVGGHAVIRIEA